jgi:hypothetical protein
MPDTVKNADVPQRKPSLITFEEWELIVSRLFRFIDDQLAEMEHRHKKSREPGDKDDPQRKPLNADDTRQLNAISRAIERVQVVNEKAARAETSERAQKALKEGNEARERFKRRLARFVGSEGE